MLKKNLFIAVSTILSFLPFVFGDLQENDFPMIRRRKLNKVDDKEQIHVSHNDTSPFRHPKYPSKHPVVKPGDFSNEVFVNEEFNLIFFPIAKTACTEWVRFFMRLNNSPLWCSRGGKHGIHSFKHENIKFMSEYTLEEQTHMMTSKDWTRAIFVREPKKRVLSAFLDKSHNPEWLGFCAAYAGRGGDETECIERRHDFDFFVKKLTVTLHDNVHWLPCYDYVDKKWWKYMTFISTMKNLSHDAETLLKSVKSSIDGVSAWDRIGKHGWGADFKQIGCEDSGDSRAFLEAKPTGHKTGASKFKTEKKFYTPELEKIVENRYAKDLQNPYFYFEELKIFDDDNDSDFETTE